jgi:hypothetical protein
MAFPSSPANNATATVNGISYTYNSTNGTWTRVPASSISSTDTWSRNQSNAAFGVANTATTSVTAAFVQANAAFAAANSSSSSANISYYATLSQSGTLTTPFTGVSRFYPTGNILISKVYASLGTSASDVFSFSLLKNGSNVGLFSFTTSTYRMTTVNTSISLTSTDYLTASLVSGTNATDLVVNLQYSTQT